MENPPETVSILVSPQAVSYSYKKESKRRYLTPEKLSSGHPGRALTERIMRSVNEALSSGEPKPIISNVARGPKARGQHWKLLAEGHHLINSL